MAQSSEQPKSSRYPRPVPRLPNGEELFELLVVDRHLSAISENLRLLKLITPVNSKEIRAKYVSGNLPAQGPEFEYRHEDFDLDAVKRELYKLPIRSESELGQVYRRKRDELNDTLTMLQARGTTEFRVRSRLLYGTATKEELAALSSWLELEPDEPTGQPLTAREAVAWLRQRLAQARIHADIRLRYSLSSSAAAGENSIAVRSDATFTLKELERIFLHEAETHILRFRNGERQPFRALFYHGFPRHGDGPGNYLNTEEGLATFQEDIAGLLTNDRRRLLAGRALAIYLMDHEELGFNDVFETLKRHRFDADTAFSLAERTFRGGGFTKDHIYQTGYLKVRDAVLSGNLDLNLLLLGKVGLDWMDLVSGLYAEGEGVLHRARYLPGWIKRILDVRGEAQPLDTDEGPGYWVTGAIKLTPSDLELLKTPEPPRSSSSSSSRLTLPDDDPTA